MKIITRKEAAAKINDESTLVLCGFCGFVAPDEVLLGIRESFEEEGHPKDLTVLKGVSLGDFGERGASRIAAPGLVKRIFAAHIGLEPGTMKLVSAGEAEMTMLPLGTVLAFERAAASGQKDIITKVGLGTFADPDVDSAALADKILINSEEYLHYKAMPIDVAVIRMTSADEDGNLSCEREAIRADQFEAAAAAHNSGGIVIAQVERIVSKGAIPPRDVAIHGFMVDYLVVASPENHIQGYDSDEYRPELTGEIKKPIALVEPMPFSERKICGRRAFRELEPSSLVNLGIGMPDAVAAVAAEEGKTDLMTLSLESGVLGGVPCGGLGLGASTNPEAVYSMSQMIDLYDGGALDMAVLGLAEADRYGNVNVSKFGGRTVGPGGFVDISQNAKKVVFVGTFVTKNGEKKFKKDVEQITFSGKNALKNGQEVLYVTERAVFRLTENGVELTEIAPGMDVDKDIISQMEFEPHMSPELKEMEDWLFSK